MISRGGIKMKSTRGIRSILVWVGMFGALCKASLVAAQPALTTAPANGQELPTVNVNPSTDLLPDISLADQVLLTKTAREAFAAKVTTGVTREPRYRPPALRNLKAIIHLTLRYKGHLWAESESPEMEVMDGAIAAGLALAEAALKRQPRLEELDKGGQDLGLEFELLGPWEYLNAKYTSGGVWSEELLSAFEPGVEGIGVEYQGRRAWVRPSEIISLNLTPDTSIMMAEKNLGLSHDDKIKHGKEIKYFRVRSYHVWQSTSRIQPIRLTRGALVVSRDGISSESLDVAIARIGNYLQYRQNSSGWFAQNYLPTMDQYDTEANSALLQMRALDGLARYGAWSGDQKAIEGAVKASCLASNYLYPLMIEKDAANASSMPTASSPATSPPDVIASGLVLWFPGHADQLENSARMLSVLGMMQHYAPVVGNRPCDIPSRTPTTSPVLKGPSTTQPTVLPFGADQAGATSQPVLSIVEKRAGLLEGLLTAQDADGRLEMVFTTRSSDEKENARAAGYALAVLASADSAHRDERIRKALEKALVYYRNNPSIWTDPLAAAALAEAFALSYVWTNDARASELVFTVLDELASLQLTPQNNPWPELSGAIHARGPGVVGIDTAIYLAALAEGLRLAERIGDADRADRYRQAVRWGTRFVLQLEFREEGSYYCRNRRDTLGGVRAALWDNRLRVDHCAAALQSLMRAREVLYGERNPSRAAGPR